MTAEQYFNDKIDWKGFNFIIDACTAIEDVGSMYLLNICVLINDDRTNDITGYKAFYYSVNTDGHFDYNVSGKKLDLLIKSYENKGLFFMLVLTKKDKDIALKIGDKLKNSNKVQFVQERETIAGNLEYIIKTI